MVCLIINILRYVRDDRLHIQQDKGCKYTNTGNKLVAMYATCSCLTVTYGKDSVLVGSNI